MYAKTYLEYIALIFECLLLAVVCGGGVFP